MAYAYPNELGKPNLDSLHDLRYLFDTGVLSLEDIKVTTEEIGKPEIPNPIEMKAAKALISNGPSTPENPSGMTVLGTPVSVWPEMNHFAQIKAAELLQAKGTDTWTLSQTSSSFEFPAGESPSASLFEAKLYAGLPIPTENTPLDEILEFKQNRSSALIKFRHAIDNLYLKMLSSPDTERELRKASEYIDLAVQELSQCLDERKIKTLFTTLNLYLNLNDSKLVSTILGAFGASGLNVPLVVGAAVGLGANTLLTFATRCIDKPVLVPTELKDFMYLYETKKYWSVQE